MPVQGEVAEQARREGRQGDVLAAAAQRAGREVEGEVPELRAIGLHIRSRRHPVQRNAPGGVMQASGIVRKSGRSQNF